MRFERWERFLGGLSRRRRELDVAKFRTFVASLDDMERIPMLLHAYAEYRALSDSCGSTFEESAYSVLIGSILESGVRPDRAEALAILRGGYHRCGHGGDVTPPVALAEEAFRNEPYTRELFDAAIAYRETLRSLTAGPAWAAKRRIEWMLWHDPRNVGKTCGTGRIQRAIHAMPRGQAFAWQWLLRNTPSERSMNSTPGKEWKDEGRRRLERLGSGEFFARFEEWFAFPESTLTLSAPGSAILRVLLWCGGLIDPRRTLASAARVAHVRWENREPAAKVIGAYAAMLRKHRAPELEREVAALWRDWREDVGEVQRLGAA